MLSYQTYYYHISYNVIISVILLSYKTKGYTKPAKYMYCGTLLQRSLLFSPFQLELRRTQIWFRVKVRPNSFPLRIGWERVVPTKICDAIIPPPPPPAATGSLSFRPYIYAAVIRYALPITRQSPPIECH